MKEQQYSLGQVLYFGQGGNSEKYISKGWGVSIDDHRWTINDVAELHLVIDNLDSPCILRINCLAYLGNGVLTHQAIVVKINGIELGNIDVKGLYSWYELQIPSDFHLDNEIIVQLYINKPLSPKSCGLNNDDRKIGLRVTEFQITKASREKKQIGFNNSNGLFSIVDKIDLDNIGKRISDASLEIIMPELLRSIAKIKSAKRAKLNTIKNDFLIKMSPVFSNVDMVRLTNIGLNVVTENPNTWVEQNNTKNCIYILTSNNCICALGLEKYKKFYIDHPNDWIIVWDYDNHHGRFSLDLAIHSDIYIPAHPENISQLGRLANHDIEIVPCGTEQFSKEQILAVLPNMLQPRKIEPLGMHHKYDHFVLRNYVIEIFGKHFSKVGFPVGVYNFKNSTDNLTEWMSYSCSLVSPVNGDLPIRVFDALITGGIPIVPYYLEHRLLQLGVPRHYFVTYNFAELDDPVAVVEKANKLFIEQGKQGIEERIAYTLENHHIHARLMWILDILGKHGCNVLGKEATL